jgi:hypothetical protein
MRASDSLLALIFISYSFVNVYLYSTLDGYDKPDTALPVNFMSLLLLSLARRANHFCLPLQLEIRCRSEHTIIHLGCRSSVRYTLSGITARVGSELPFQVFSEFGRFADKIALVRHYLLLMRMTVADR